MKIHREDRSEAAASQKMQGLLAKKLRGEEGFYPVSEEAGPADPSSQHSSLRNHETTNACCLKPTEFAALCRHSLRK